MEPVREGPSGSGKTTLLRSLADPLAVRRRDGARPPATTRCSSPSSRTCPGVLRIALAYPGPASGVDDERATRCCAGSELLHLAADSTRKVAWARRLSPGEQQRLASGACCSPARAWCSSTRRRQRSTRGSSTPCTRCCASSCRRRSSSASAPEHAPPLPRRAPGTDGCMPVQVATLSHRGRPDRRNRDTLCMGPPIVALPQRSDPRCDPPAATTEREREWPSSWGCVVLVRSGSGGSWVALDRRRSGTGHREVGTAMVETACARRSMTSMTIRSTARGRSGAGCARCSPAGGCRWNVDDAVLVVEELVANVLDYAGPASS